MPRSHDEYFFAQPPLMIDGMPRPPRIDLDNHHVRQRHIHAVLLSDFVRSWNQERDESLRTIGRLLETGEDGQSPLDQFLAGLGEALIRNNHALRLLRGVPLREAEHAPLIEAVSQAFREARDYLLAELRMYEEVITDLNGRIAEKEAEKKYDATRKMTNLRLVLLDRMERLRQMDWVTFFSDRSVLASYAFPIYNVTLETSDRDLKLERDLRQALAEYPPARAS